MSAANDKYEAFCNICRKEFKIDGSGRSQVHITKSHCWDGGENTKKIKDNSNQLTFPISGVLQPESIVLSLDDQVATAEIYQARQVVAANYSFASTNSDSERVKLMFPNSPVASHYSMTETKVKYIIQFGIADYCKEELVYDIKECPFTFKFDETRNRMVKKQYDGYFQYWSPKEDKVVNVYAGSVFIAHCDSDDLVTHCNELLNNLNVDSQYLLHLGVDGPNVNLAFHKKLLTELGQLNGETFLNLGTCSLHPAHTAFRKGIKQLSGYLDAFFIDIDFFLNCQVPEEKITRLYMYLLDVFAIKHVESRWLTMKYVALRTVEQWANLQEYFLKFLPKQNRFTKL